MVGRVLVAVVCCLVAVPVSEADALWEWVTPWPQGHSLSAAAIGNGVRVAVGGLGTVITSTDGVEWRTSRTGADYRLSDVAWGNGLFVAVGSEVGWEFNPVLGVILTSDNGVDWVERYRTDRQTLDAVAWTGSRFVAGGVGDTVLLSADGLSWSEQQIETGGWTMGDIAWNGSLLVAIGADNVFPYGHSSFFTSENGDVWRVQNFECEFCNPVSIAAVGGRFVAVGSWQKVLVSDDGLTWTEVPYESPSGLEVIVGAGDRFLATGRDVVGTSPDGYVWTIEDLPTESRVNGLTWSGDGYLAVGEDGFMMSSPEGSVWTRLSEMAFDLSGSWEINELASNGSTIVGVGEGAVIITGRHGTNWSRRYSPATHGELEAVIWNGDAFWTAGSAGVMASLDGVHWAWRLMDDDLDLFDIAWNGSLFVAVGRRSTFVDDVIETRDIVLTSPDGHDWAGQLFDLDGNLFTVGWTGSQFVAAGSGSVYLTSGDGAAWQQRFQLAGVTMWDMASDGSRLVAVGGRYDVGGVIYSTSDGVQWTGSLLPETPDWGFRDVTWTGTHFVAVARTRDPSIFTSTDGFFWSTESTGTGVWPVSVVGDERSLYATGRGLRIIRRTQALQGPEAPRRPGGRMVPVGDRVRAVAPIQR